MIWTPFVHVNSWYVVCVYVYTIKIGTCIFMYALVLCLLVLRFVYQAYMSRVFPAAFQSCDKESRGGGRCMLFLFHFFLILFLWGFFAYLQWFTPISLWFTNFYMASLFGEHHFSGILLSSWSSLKKRGTKIDKKCTVPLY